MCKRSILMLVFAGAACASFPPPTDTVASALAAMRGAEELGAESVPPASLQLQLAREELGRAQRLMADGKHERAHNMALRAAHDAEVAIALTREAKAQDAAARARRTEAGTTPAQAIATPEVTP